MGRHRKPTDTTGTFKKIALGATVGLGAAVVPATSAAAATDSQWEAVAIPEASGNWFIDHSGDGLSVGGLQFQNPSWQDALSYLRSQGIDTSSFPPSLYQGMPNVPSKAHQMLAGEALLHLQGPGAWANGNGSGLSPSMFDGGPVPATVAASGLLDGTKWGSATPKATDTPKATAPVKPTPKPKAGSSTGCVHTQHTVMPGDTLYAIAKYHTGDASKDNWKGLYEANRGVIGGDPDLIYPGEVLELPWSDGKAPAPKAEAPAKPAPKSKASAPASSGYVAPVEGRVGDNLIVGSGGSMSRSAGGHSGLDISAPAGTPVGSVAAGTVVSINASGASYGNHVVVKHADGMYTLYAHMASITVSVGQSVGAGQQVGTVGSTGNSSGPHLHFEVRTHPTDFSSGIFRDPVAYLLSHGVSI